jgi:hypothetical protein
MGLGSIFGGVRGEASLTKLLKKYDRKQTLVPLTVTDFVRTSGFHRICPREEVLRSVHKIDKEDFISPDTLLTFNHGSGIHWALQNIILPDLGVLLGMWKCQTCAFLHGAVADGLKPTTAAIRRPSVCGQRINAFPSLSCLGEDFVFVEYDLKDDQHRITGHADGFLALPGMSGMGILEAKSISSQQVWLVKNSPKVEHYVQAQIYMWLTGLEWGLIVYWEKGAYGLKAIKEHFIERDDQTISKVKSELRSLWDGLASGVLPFRICSSPECERALKCSATSSCFDGYTPEVDDGVGKF